MIKLLAPLSMLALVLVSGTTRAATPDTFKSLVEPFLQKHCVGCHGPDAKEGDVALHTLTEVNANNAQVWKIIWEQVALKNMPPKSQSTQPTSMQRVAVADAITRELDRALQDKGGFESHLLPEKGNHIDHSLLFGPLPPNLPPTSTPARLCRIHPNEHLVRLNALVDDEPEYDPERPGRRMRGDAVQHTYKGELKVYFGLDLLSFSIGKYPSYEVAISGVSFPPMLDYSDRHGLRNYPIQYTVNGAETTQIATTAENILRFMAFGPEAKPYQFANSKDEVDPKYLHRALRGEAHSLFYRKDVQRPLTPIYYLMRDEGVSQAHLKSSVEFLFQSLTGRSATNQEVERYVGIANKAIQKLGKNDGVILGLTPIFLDRETLFRTELAATGKPDALGRVMLQDQELVQAVNSAFCYLPPDKTLQKALAEDRLKTRDDVRREVSRILADDSISKPRILQFFQEYFDYERAPEICKDKRALHDSGGNTERDYYYGDMNLMVHETDRLVELVLHEDQQVLRELLTTRRVVTQSGKKAYPYFDTWIADPAEKVEKRKGKQTYYGPPPTTEPVELPKGKSIVVRVPAFERRSESGRVLTTLPETQRMGILTHPTWLVAHSDAMDNHAILRGKWVRERLLGGAVPDVPITVDAVLPDEPESTLRQRMRVTREEYCWRCHQKMDPLGLPFEMYNHLGLYRKQEQGKPVDTTGAIVDSGDPALDGPVTNALEMIEKLSKSERVEQVFVRHVFRFWMGRNETLADAPVLQEAHRAYRDNNGSMRALLTSLLTSDAFLYRKVSAN